MSSTIGEYRDRARDPRTTDSELDTALTAQSITFVATATRQQKVKLLMDAVKGKKRSDPAPYDFPPLATTTTLSIITATLPGATVGTAYPALTLAAAGGTAPYTWDVTGLPAGITHAVGVISGTPSAAGTFSVTIKVTDAAGTTMAQTLSVVVASAAAPVPPAPTPVNQPPGPARAGHIWVLSPRRFRGGYHWVQVPDPAAPAPTPIPPPQHARHGHNQFDGGLLLWLLGLLGILAIAALLTFWVIVPAARWGWDQSWEDDDDTTNKISGLTAEEVQKLIDANKGTKSDTDKPDTGSDKLNGTCQPGDKVGTWSEGNNPHRIEVGGHGVQHLDFYPAKGVKSVSYIVSTLDNPSGVPDIANGFGSIWEWNPPGCQYDHVADETNYAKARLDSGHSGIVVDLRTSPPTIVGNVANMSEANIRALLGTHAAAMERNGQKFSFTNVSFSLTSNALTAKQPAGECKAETKTLPPGSTVTVNAPAIANVWTNKPSPPPWGQAEVKVLIEDGSLSLINVGGTIYEYPAGCSVNDDFAKNGLPAKTVSELHQAGLAK